MISSNWDEESCELLIDLLRKKEYLYNRQHANYRTYTIIKECTEFGNSLKTPRSSKDVVDKITLFRKEFLKTTAILEADDSQSTQVWPYYAKCSFMYFPLFGKPIESLKRKMAYSETSNDETYRLTKKEKREEIIEMPSTSFTKYDEKEDSEEMENEEKDDEEMVDEEMMDDEEDDYEENYDKDEFSQTIVDLKDKVKKQEKKKSYIQIGCMDNLKKVIQFLRENPYIFDAKYQKFHNNPYKSKVLEKFGKTFAPPLTGKQVQRKMRYLRKRFFDALKTKKFDWPYFEECRFFLGTKFADTDEDLMNVDLLQKENDDESQSITLTGIFTRQVIDFIRDKPILYDPKHPDYNDHEYKTKMIAGFCKKFDPLISVRRMKRKIQTMKNNFFKSLKGNNKKWLWFDECQFFLDTATKKTEKNIDRSKNQNKEKISEETSQTNARIPTIDIINFVRDKPFLYNTEHPLFQDFKMKNKICEKFGKEYEFPVSGYQIRKKINDLKRHFFDSLKYKDYWRWYEECQFFLDGKNDEFSVENKILLEEFELKKKGIDNVDEEPEDELSFPVPHMEDFLKFLRDNPYLYNEEHPFYQDYRFKKHIFKEYGKSFKPVLSAWQVRNKMRNLKREFFESLKDKELTKEPWAWFDDCQFFLDKNKDVSTENKELYEQFQKKKIEDLEKKNTNAHNIKEVIDFLQDKPYMYDKSHPKFEDKYKKYKECRNFGETFDPPLSANTIAEKIIYIKNQIVETQQLLKESNNDPIHKWRWYDECNFMHKVLQNNTITLLSEDLDFQTYKSKKIENSNIKIEIANFVEDNPFLYDRNHSDYNNAYLKNKVRENLINTLEPEISEDKINELIDAAIKKISSSTLEEEEDFIVSNLENFYPVDNMSIKSEHLTNNTSETLVESKSTKVLVDSSIQCNLFDELWQQRLSETDFNQRSCRCIEEFFEINTPIQLLPKSEESQYDDNEYSGTENVKDETKSSDSDECNSVILQSRINQANQKFYTTQMINFIKDKPFLYESKHPYFNKHAFKESVLKEFGKDYDPPIPVQVLRTKVNTLKHAFARSIRNNKPEKWCWADSCQFFLNKTNKVSPENEQLYLKFQNKNSRKSKKNDKSKTNMLSHDISDTPVSHDINDIPVLHDISDTPVSYDFSYTPVSHEMSDTQVSHDNSDTPDLDDWPPYEETSSSSEDETIKFFGKPKRKKNLDKMEKLPDGTYACDKCNRKFAKLAAVKIHQRSHDDNSLLCMKCGKVNKTMKILRMHELYCDLDKQKFCYECNRIYKTHLNYNDHLNQYHERAKPYICVCLHSFQTYDRFILHLNTYKCGSIEKCTVPDYITKEYLATFIEIAHYEDEDYGNEIKKTKFWCRICKINHIINKQYMRHFTHELHLEAENYWMEKFNIQKIFPCEFCTDGKNIFDNLCDLVRHRHGVHRKCTLNDYFEKLEKASTEILNIIKEPIPSEYSECLSACRICRQEFFFKEFKEHFQDEEHLKLEESWIVKYNIESFVCQICCSEFEKLSDFLSHQYDEHNIWPINRNLKQLEGAEIGLEPNIQKKFRYYCSLCDEYFRNRREYYDHLHLHKNISPYICSCGKSFRRHQLLVTHAKHRCVKEGQIIPDYAIIGVIQNEVSLEASSLKTNEEDFF